MGLDPDCEHAARAYSVRGGLGTELPAGYRAEPIVKGLGSLGLPPKLKGFGRRDTLMRQNLQVSVYFARGSINGKNVLK